jgi:hypothetical protein
MDRTRHKSSAMVALHARQARTWGVLGLGVLGPLNELIPEMKSLPHGTEGTEGSPEKSGPHWAAIGPRAGGGTQGTAIKTDNKQILGGVAEWSKAAVLKTAELARVPGVRIPSPPLQLLAKVH